MSSSQPAVRKVAIIGAGMGGLALAIALRKVGIEVRVFEQAPRFAPVGICLSVFPNGHRVLAALSPRIGQRIRERGYVLETLCIRKPNGEAIAQKAHEFEARFGLPLIAIRWSSLQELLRSELPEDVIELDHQVAELCERERGIEVRLAKGQSETFDLAVAADGIHSRFRQRLHEDAPKYAGASLVVP